MADSSKFVIAGAVGVLAISVGAWGFNTYVKPSLNNPQTAQVSGSKQAPIAGNAIPISIASSNTKEKWLAERVESFNKASANDSNLQSDGRPVYITVLKEDIDGKKKDYRSGTMVSDTIKGNIEPTVLSPGDESWIDKFNKEWKKKSTSAAITGDAPILLSTPLVPAMWQSRAEALGCWPTPGPSCTWSHIRSLATAKNGWGALGHPGWGLVKLGYGYFGESNSGTLGTVAMCMAATHKAKGLEATDVSKSSSCGQFLAAVEKAKVHSGKADTWLLEEMANGGPDYMDAVITYESNVIDFNIKNGKNLREPLVAVYPQDGTVVAAHPYAILNNAPWVTTDQAEAAKVFRGYLLGRESQERALSFGIRPSDKAVKIASPIDQTNGANPNAKLVLLSLPSVDVMDRIGEVWKQTKKPVVVVMVFDKSGSMQGSKITAAIKGAQKFVQSMNPNDILVWMPFDSEVAINSIEGKKSDIGEKLLKEIGGTTIGSGTQLYQAVITAYSKLQGYQKQYGTTMRYGIVILSDGADDGHSPGKDRDPRTLSEVEALLKPSETDANGIQAHAVAIGGDADENTLKTITTAGHGICKKGENIEDMEKYYKEIASYF